MVTSVTDIVRWTKLYVCHSSRYNAQVTFISDIFTKKSLWVLLCNESTSDDRTTLCIVAHMLLSFWDSNVKSEVTMTVALWLNYGSKWVTKWCHNEFTWWLSVGRHLGTSLWSHHKCCFETSPNDFILMSLEDTSNNKYHDDFTVTSLGDLT